jgi:hypothetical protein
MRLSHSQNALVLACSEPRLPGEANIATSLTESFALRLLACGIDGLPALATARSKFQIGKPGCHACIPSKIDPWQPGTVDSGGRAGPGFAMIQTAAQLRAGEPAPQKPGA